MDVDAAERAAAQAGLVTVPIGLALVAAPTRVGRLLGSGDYDRALRVIGGLDLALVPGLVVGRPRGPWLAARVGLNIVIGGYCASLMRGTGGRGAVVGAAAMVAASASDVRALRALYRVHR